MYQNIASKSKLRISVWSLFFVLQSCVGFSISEINGVANRSRRAAESRTKRFLSTEDDFMASLRNRVEEVNDRATKLPLVVLDSMLPRQVLKFQCKNALLLELLGDCLQKETPFFGMLGMARLRNGQQVHLKTGVEVEIVKTESVGEGILVELEAGRRFTIEGEVENVGGGWTEARVNFLDSEEQEEEETKGEDRMTVARAMAKAKEFTSPNMNMQDNMSLVDRWAELARKVERQPGQIDELLEQLGEIPPSEEPSERAFWVGALINPIPAMGVAMEVRPLLLSAKTAEERVRVAQDGLLRSIKHMDGSELMF
jgi:hypothetical protein